MMMAADILPLLTLSPVLVAVAISDLRFLRIPNLLVLSALGVFLCAGFFLPITEVGLRVASAFVVFAVGFVAFAFGKIGGGDVKMTAALVLFVPSGSLTTFGYSFCAATLVGVGISLWMQSRASAQNSTWAACRADGKFPMGLSIALAGLSLPVTLQVM